MVTTVYLRGWGDETFPEPLVLDGAHEVILHRGLPRTTLMTTAESVRIENVDIGRLLRYGLNWINAPTHGLI
jgi:hypothetical protein